MENIIILNIRAVKAEKVVRIIFNAAVMLSVVVGTVINGIKINIFMILSAFTVQSNLFCLVMAFITLVRENRGRKTHTALYIFFKGMALTSILLTFIIYNFVLRPFFNGEKQDIESFIANVLHHEVVPLIMLADFLVFEDKGYFKPYYPFVWTAFPLAYLGYTALHKAFGGVYQFIEGKITQFPYFFLDYKTYGLKTVLIWMLLIFLVFIAFSYILFVIDFIIAKIHRSREKYN